MATTNSLNDTVSGETSAAQPNGAPSSDQLSSPTATRRTAKSATSSRKRSSGGASTSSRSTSSRKTATSAKRNARTTTTRAGDYAERAVLIPVGAALIARERVAASVGDVVSVYSSSSKIEAQLRRFERRGNTARNQLEREVRKTRTRLEREMRQRRREIVRRRSRFSKDLTEQVEQAQKQIEKTQSWFEDAVRTSFEDGSDLVNRVQERVLSRV